MSGRKEKKEDRTLLWTYYPMVLIAAVVYLLVPSGKVITQQYGVGLLVLLFVLFILERIERIRFITVARILLLPLAVPILFWTTDGAGMPISAVAVFWHMFVAFMPILVNRNLSKAETK